MKTYSMKYDLPFKGQEAKKSVCRLIDPNFRPTLLVPTTVRVGMIITDAKLLSSECTVN